ncbi:MAG: hypothetical protein ACO3K7_03300 [Candidatus Marinamargulisbacteria bacterium]
MIKITNLILLSLIISNGCVDLTRVFANAEFELNDPPPVPKKSQKKPLFDLLNNSDTPMTRPNTPPPLTANPFLKQHPIPVSKPNIIQPTIKPENLFEYKVSAIWKIDTKYKALLSGQIVETGDKVNDINVVKITQSHITVKRKKKQRRFRIGAIFYDFQI